MVWAKHGRAAVDKISPNAYARMFVSQQPGTATIANAGFGFQGSGENFLRRPEQPRLSVRTCKRKAGARPAFAVCDVRSADQYLVSSVLSKLSTWRPPVRPSRSGSSGRP